ncbi:hypothetical protein SAMN05443432_10647 [Roseovarius litoreus]|jgi:hypothetical protein|uniref:Uncharacterized protein n=1 Tax=Roseovarius litoreus TaxID=1155722 RepID=A0A1M7HKV6_9RHOB|nr:hypothetical protein [Roseovarius litoreus]SHM29171.1 hypothetical protein SAMN05443432_10647 [Roseovarius litoreus]
MNPKDPIKKAATAAQSREDRLKSALKANLARRKAQARARSGDEAADRPEAPEDKD